MISGYTVKPVFVELQSRGSPGYAAFWLICVFIFGISRLNCIRVKNSAPDERKQKRLKLSILLLLLALMR